MRLTKCTIVGFKSFALSTTIHFDGSVVAIVGPNGCGKSNIVDAFRWVLGENSGHLRGERLEDVLFAGTEGKKAQNIAKVSLTFSGVKESLSLPFDELTITRSYQREGESEYLINGKSARLKEVQMLFSGSGVGKDAFAIFEQGKLDQIIYLQPSERRKLFDEAAGIGRFLVRKKESMQKLKEVDQNCLRIQDLYREGEKKVEKLQKQATLAEKNIKLQNEKEFLNKAERLLRYRTIEKSHQESHAQLEAAIVQFSEKVRDYEEVQAEYGVLQEKIAYGEKQKQDLQKQLWQLHSEIKGEEVRLEEKKRRYEDNRLEKEKSQKLSFQIKKELQALIQQKEAKLEIMAHCTTQKQEKERDLEKKRSLYASIEKELLQLEIEREKKRKEQRAFLEKVQAYALQLQESKSQLKNLDKELSLTLLQQEEELRKKEALHSTLEEGRTQLAILATELSHLRLQLDQIRQSKSVVLEKRRAVEQELQFHSKSIQEEQAKEKALRHLEESKEGFSESAKLLLSLSVEQGSPFYGKIKSLRDLLLPHEDATKWLGVALYIYAYTLVVETKEDLGQLMHYIDQNNIKNFSLLCVEGLSAKKPMKGSLYDHVADTPLATHLLGNILVEKELCLSSAKINYVTEDGYFVDENGVIFCHKAEGIETNSYLRKIEIEKSGKKVAFLLIEQGKEELLLENLQEEERALQEQMMALEISFRKKEMMHLTEKISFQNKSDELNGRVIKEEQLNQKVHSFQKERATLLTRIEQIEKEYEIALQEEKALVTVLLEIEHHCEKEGSKRRQERADLENAQRMYQEMFVLEKEEQSEKTLLEQTIHIKEESLKTEEKRIILVESEEVQLVEEQNQIRIRLSQKREQSSALQQELEVIEKEGKILQTTYQKSKEQLQLLEKNRQQAKEKRYRLELAVAHLLSQKEMVEKEGIYEVELPSMTVEEMKVRGQEILFLLQKSGPINFASIEELKKEQRECTQIREQLDDILKAKEDLEQTIQALEQESKKSFTQHFKRVRTQFQHYFSLLFTGGEADLVLQKEGDFFDAGIEIHARPPGKKMQKISLLSGGERCLTALALLFAFFSAKPAPFCILDEVDAPLDDANVERFTNLLTQFTGKTQFIVVTHNKKTMGVADILIGVSMEEKGVSKLLSLSFEKQKVELTKV